MVRQVEGSPPVDPRETELFDKMVLDTMEYIHGVATEEIVKVLENSVDTVRSMATIAYKAVRGVAEKNQATAQIEMDMDMMMGLTAETIEMVEEIVVASGQMPQGANSEQMRQDTMLRVAVLHGEQLESAGFTDEQRQMAETDLRDYMSDAGMDKAFNYINDRAKSEGVNPEDMKRAGNEMVFGSRRPIHEAIKIGLGKQTAPLMTGASMKAAPMSPEEVPPLPPEPTQEPAPLMGSPPQPPNPLPTGEGLVPSGLPPAAAPNEEIAPPRRM